MCGFLIVVAPREFIPFIFIAGHGGVLVVTALISRDRSEQLHFTPSIFGVNVIALLGWVT